MNKPKVAALLVLLLGAPSAQARAQGVEISAGVGGVGLADGGDFWGRGLRSPVVDVTGSVTLNDRFAIESFVTYGRRAIPVAGYGATVLGVDTQRTEGLYGFVVRQRLRATTRPGFHAFVTYGIGGLYAKDTAPQRQYVYGSTVVTEPGWTYSRTSGPGFPILGIGIRKSLGSHLALRAEAEMMTFLWIPVGARGSVGVTVPLGRAR